MAGSTVGTTTLLLAKTVSEEKETNGEKKYSKGVGGWKGALIKAVIRKNNPTPEGRNEERKKKVYAEDKEVYICTEKKTRLRYTKMKQGTRSGFEKSIKTADKSRQRQSVRTK